MIPTIDFNEIAVEMEMDPEDILHLMTLYRDELEKDLTELEMNLSQNNWLPVKSKLHKMKGDAANLFLTDLAAVFADMETASLKMKADTLQKQMALLRQLQSGFLTDFENYAAEKR